MSSPKQENVRRHFVSGMCGGFTTTVILCPLDVLKTRLQVNNGTGMNVFKNFYVVAKDTYQLEGLRAFYQGISPAILGSVLSWSLYFSFYENAKNRYKRILDVKQLSGFYNMISSLEAGMIGSTIACPVWFLKTRLQLQNRMSRMPGYVPYKGMIDATYRIIKEEGIKTLYTGLLPSLLLTSHAAIQFVIYEYLKQLETRYQIAIDYKTGLYCGAVSKFCASLITYPLQVFRSRMQQLNAKSFYENLVDCAVKVWKKEGILGLYGGFLPNLIRVIPNSSITLMTYEFVNSFMRDHHIFDYNTMDWVKDEDVHNCMRCNVPFTALRRRHHCRICKKVFCDSCSSQRLPLNNVMERVCKDCFSVEKSKRDQWELITNCGFCSPCGKAIQYPDFGCLLREDGSWSCKEKPYMVLDLEKKIWTVKMEDMKGIIEIEEEKKVEETKPKSRASSISSTSTVHRRDRVTFKDIVSGNISEEVLKASTVPQSQEKVYELERVDGTCQTEEQPVMSITPVCYMTLTPEEMASLRQVPQVSQEEEEVELVPPPLKETKLAVFTERGDIIKLTSAVTESSKLYRQRMTMVTERRALRKEEDEDEKDVKEARDRRLQGMLNDNSLAIDESKMTLDNLVCHFQNLSSRYNKIKTHRIVVSEAVPDVEEKVRAAQEQFETLSHDSLKEIAAQQLVHLQQFRSLSSTYRTMYEEEMSFADDCMSILMDQQESINQCLNKCISTVSSLMNEFETVRERCNELELRVKRNEETADKTIEEAAETIQAAERLSFLSEQQLYDIEKQYRLQEKRLLEIQTMLQLKESENQKLKKSIKEIEERECRERERVEKEYRTEQWEIIQPPEQELKEETEENSHQADIHEIHSFLENWSENKSLYYMNQVEEWLERIMSGRDLDSEYNTIRINMFDLKQRDLFVKRILPLIWNRKNLDCFVQEHKRQEFDYRITVMNNDEAIPAISVPSGPVATKEEEKEETELDSQFVFVQKESDEEDEGEELRQSDIDSSSSRRKKKEKSEND